MASYGFYSLGLLLLLCLLISGGVQGRILHAVQRDTNRSSLKVLSNGSGKVASQTSLLTQTGGIHQDAARPNYVHHMTTYQWKEGRYYGVKADISIYSLPSVQANQMSTSAVWVKSNSNFIAAGWHVSPDLYGDNKTHFFIAWSADAPGGIEKSNCYNLMCKGGFFPSERSNLRPGDTLDKVSVYNGYQSYLTLKISQDSITRNWWLYNSANDEFPVGYWPLLPELAEGASNIFLGGMVHFIKHKTTSPPMGNGHFPSEGDGRAASFRRIKFVDKENKLHDPSDDEVVNEDKESCYAVGALQNFNEEEGYVFYYGGPDGCKD